jgi:hypothetical protein
LTDCLQQHEGRDFSISLDIPWYHLPLSQPPSSHRSLSIIASPFTYRQSYAKLVRLKPVRVQHFLQRCLISFLLLSTVTIYHTTRSDLDLTFETTYPWTVLFSEDGPLRIPFMEYQVRASFCGQQLFKQNWKCAT